MSNGERDCGAGLQRRTEMKDRQLLSENWIGNV